MPWEGPVTDEIGFTGCLGNETSQLQPRGSAAILANCDTPRPHNQATGFDVFSFEPRNQGDSDCCQGYDPLQWVTDYEVNDIRAAVQYLKSRGDADPRGIGFFGISKGGSAGLLAAASDPYLCCFVTDGIFATYTTMVPYMQKWVSIYSPRKWLHPIVPSWYYGLVGNSGLRRIERDRHCRFPHLERTLDKLAPRPWLMIHGGADSYIKPEMARALFERAGQPKEFWLVEGAKHNQALQVAGGAYRQRVLEFFLKNLALAGNAGTTGGGQGRTTLNPAMSPQHLQGPTRRRRTRSAVVSGILGFFSLSS
jgi:pimeloyl-ACP methyl ester carboxylesterase